MLRGDRPGVSREYIKVQIDDGFLLVRREQFEEDKADAGRIWQERPTGKFARSYRLPEDAADAEVRATYTTGVLEARVTDRESADSSRLVPIN